MAVFRLLFFVAAACACLGTVSSFDDYDSFDEYDYDYDYGSLDPYTDYDHEYEQSENHNYGYNGYRPSIKPKVPRWGRWGPWSTCSSSCRSGFKTRVRQCLNGFAGQGKCMGPFQVKKCWVKCNNQNTDCYDPRNPTSYQGRVTKTVSGKRCVKWRFFTDRYGSVRTQKNFCRDPSGDGNGPWCFTNKKRRLWDYCDVPYCNQAYWKKWGEWSSCTKSCTVGVRKRVRECKNGKVGEGNCIGNVVITQSCRNPNCPGSMTTAQVTTPQATTPQTLAPVTTPQATTPSKIVTTPENTTPQGTPGPEPTPLPDTTPPGVVTTQPKTTTQPEPTPPPIG
nr:semaphorin-5B [Ciona intestinalis]|eukprot:XP_002123490.1 semaphorin-5B [Ciona intestinalis]